MKNNLRNRIPGVPKKEIDIEKAKALCGVQCTKTEIAHYFNVSENIVSARIREATGLKFNEFFEIHRVEGLISLRRAQFKLAEKNPIMAIHLGKLYLGQADTSGREKVGIIKIVKL